MYTLIPKKSNNGILPIWDGFAWLENDSSLRVVDL